MRLLAHFKQVLRRSAVFRRTFFSLKKTFFFFLGYTPLKAIADIYLGTPIKDFIFFPEKIYLFNRMKPYTMALYHQMDNAYTLAQLIGREDVPGSFVECGGRQDSVAIIMASVDSNRKTWYFNFSEDIPELVFSSLNVADVPGLHCPNGMVMRGGAERLLRRYKREIGPIAILRLNSSSYECTTETLEQLYDSVVKSGFIIASDYGGVLGQREAVDYFFEEKKGEICRYAHVDGEAVFQKIR